MPQPPIVFIYGASSSGKTTVATDNAFVNFAYYASDNFCYREEISHPAMKKAIKEKIFQNDNTKNKVSVKLEEKIDQGQSVDDIACEAVHYDASGSMNELYALIDFETLSYYDKYSLINSIYHAVEKIYSGYPVIFDIVPNPRFNPVHIFLTTLERYNLKAFVILLYCPIALMIQRIDARNNIAIVNDRSSDIREGPFPFFQYSNVFTSKGVGDIVDTFESKILFNNLSKRFCKKTAQNIFQLLGLDHELCQAQEALYVRFSKYNEIYNTGLYSAAEVSSMIRASCDQQQYYGLAQLIAINERIARSVNQRMMFMYNYKKTSHHDNTQQISNKEKHDYQSRHK